MQISKLIIKNLRAVKELTISIDPVTALLGGNNAGKSTVLKALEVFFEASPKLHDDDFFMREDVDIEVVVEFINLVPSEVATFGNAVVDDKITIRRILQKEGDKQPNYETLAKSYPPFAKIREIAGKSEKRLAYNAMAKDIDGLEIAASADAVDAAMEAWEAANPDELQLAYRRGFFGAANIANATLKKKTSLRLVPAVADAQTETGDARKSPIISLLSDITQQIYGNKKEVKEFVEVANEQFLKLVDPSSVPELGGLSQLLTASVRQYYKDSKLLADWQVTDGISVEFPRPTIKVEDQGFQTSLGNVGHGLQRASLFSIIQFLGERALTDTENNEFEEAQSDIILLVEEPEIYQHPHKQLVISDAFHKICRAFSTSTGIRFQIIFTTHSEKFVGMQKFQSARILRRVDGFKTPSHSARSISLKACSKFFAKLLNKDPMPDETFEAKMHIFSREVCEGFFAEKVILVEGVTDKAVLHGFYRSKGIDVAAYGIAIIAVDGKTKIDKPAHIFSQLGIPTYPVFDSDQSKSKSKQKPNTNKLIQRVLDIEKPADFPDGCFPRFTAFSSNLEDYLKDQIGPETFEEIFDGVAEDLGLTRDDLCKTPLAVTRIVEIATKDYQRTFQYFDEIIKAVDAL